MSQSSAPMPAPQQQGQSAPVPQQTAGTQTKPQIRTPLIKDWASI